MFFFKISDSDQNDLEKNLNRNFEESRRKLKKNIKKFF